MAFAPQVRLAYLVSHPIQYQAPLLRRIAAEPDLRLTVFFCSDVSVRPFQNQGFDRVIAWDVPLLEGYDHRFLPAWGRHGPPSFWTPLTYGFARLLRGGGFDALWVHSYARAANLGGMAAARRLGIPVLLREEASEFSLPRGPAQRVVKRAFMKGLDRLVSAYLAIGSANRDYYRAHGVAPERIFAMPYAVDNERFRTAAERARGETRALRRDLGLPEGAKVAMTVARLVPQKAIGDLIAAWAEAVATIAPGDRPRLVILGDGPLRAALEARAAGLDTVRFAGFRNQSELPAYYALADLFVLPSHREPWGLVVNEAMNAGCAILASDHVGAARDLVRPGINGAVFPAGSIALLAQSLRRLLRDPEGLAAMGRASRDIIARWSFEEDLTGLRAALASVLQR
jgi:glycosyltransferase involved in cell wall biosynthesis